MVTGPLTPEPMNTKRQEMQNELGLVIVDRGGPLVPSFGVAHSETRRAGLNKPVLLGPGQNGETRRGKTLSGMGYLIVQMKQRQE
jgi:hypothetical protein